MNTPLIPHITEKSYSFIKEGKQETSQYTFRIPKGVNKSIVKTLIEREHKVTVEDVRIINLPGKTRRFKGVVGRTSIRRKAIVRLLPGQHIASFDQEKSSAKGDSDSVAK